MLALIVAISVAAIQTNTDDFLGKAIGNKWLSLNSAWRDCLIAWARVGDGSDSEGTVDAAFSLCEKREDAFYAVAAEQLGETRSRDDLKAHWRKIIRPTLLELASTTPEQRAAPTRSPSVHDVLGRGLNALRGQAVQRAFNRLGYPDRKMTVAGAVIYYWENRTSNIDGGLLSCSVKVAVRAGRVVSAEHDGNAGACRQYAVRFQPTGLR